tara:strand:+ start:18514 stop:20598 length:2085 start_codon:yes stop_codon:yes gene_type:complete
MRFFLLLFFLISCSSNNRFSDNDWAYYRADHSVSHYKPFNQINTSNVKELKKVWEFSSGDHDLNNTSQIQCNPLIIDGILYGTTPQMKLIALNAETGENIWTFDPYKDDYKAHGTGVNRGLNIFRDKNGDRILYATFSKLYSIDSRDGTLIKSFGESGIVDLKKGLGRRVDGMLLAANTPGIIFKDKLILGHRASESTGAVPGHIRAFNIYSGEIEWIFHTIPYPNEFGYDTWPKDAYLNSGGANAWSGFSLDMENEIVYVPTGSAAFDYYGGDREGDNLFANSIIALDANNGLRLWHYQVTHHDIWDRDLPAAPNLVDIKMGNKSIKALVQITKSGYLFVLNRITGNPIYPIIEKDVPKSKLEGEKASLTQPVPTVFPIFSRNKLTELDFPIRSKKAYDFSKKLWENRVYGEFEPLTTTGNILFPGLDGGGEWGGAALHPPTNILYVNSNEIPWDLRMEKVEGKALGETIYRTACLSCHGENLEGNKGVYSNIPSLVNISDNISITSIKNTIQNGKGIMPSFSNLDDKEIKSIIDFITNTNNSDTTNKSTWPYPYSFAGFNKMYAEDGYPAIKPPWGQLTAINLNNHEIVWQVPLGNHDELSIDGFDNTGTENYGGPIVTDGGIVIIAATMDEKLRIFNQLSGELLWEDVLPAAGYATPSTYMVNGKQYIVIACGGGKLGTKSGSSYVAYSID